MSCLGGVAAVTCCTQQAITGVLLTADCSNRPVSLCAQRSVLHVDNASAAKHLKHLHNVLLAGVLLNSISPSWFISFLLIALYSISTLKQVLGMLKIQRQETKMTQLMHK
jgi:hypothetical protein